MKNLANALIKAQAEMEPLHKDAQNPHLKSKYATLAQVQDVCLPALGRQGVVVFQGVGTEWASGSPVVKVSCTLYHAESGENIVNEIDLVPAQSTPQGIGSAITYGRRYLLMTMAGIAPEDDDGESSSQMKREKQPQRQPSPVVVVEQPQHRQPEPPAEVQFMDATPAESNPFDAAPEPPAQQKPTNGKPKAGLITEGQKGILHALGEAAYGSQWDGKRRAMVEGASKRRTSGPVTSSNDLFQAEAAAIIGGLESKLRTMYEQVAERLKEAQGAAFDTSTLADIDSMSGVELAAAYRALAKLAPMAQTAGK